MNVNTVGMVKENKDEDMKTNYRFGFFDTDNSNITLSNDFKVSKLKGSKYLQMVDLSDLPKTKNSKYDWKKSIGCIIPYYSKNNYGEIKIIDYKYDNNIEKSMLLIECGDITRWIYPEILRNANIGSITGNTKLDFIYKIGEIINVGSSRFKVLDRSKKDRKRYYLECLACGDKSWKTENALLNCKDNNKLCSVCSNFKYKDGFNDIPTIEPWMIQYFQGGYDEAKLHTPYENEEIIPVCPYCGEISSRPYKISIIYRDKGFSCSCKKSGSYGEKLVAEVLNQNNIKYIKDKTLQWSSNYRYDFIIEKYKIIIEVDGEYGHGFYSPNKTYEQSEKEFEIDAYKTRIAYENGYDVIRLIYLSDYKDEFIDEIKNNLPDVFWKQTKWDAALKNILSSDKKEICLRYEKSEKERKDILDLADEYGYCENTIRNILRYGTKIKWCSYPKKR